MLDWQKFKCSPNNACSFGRGLKQIFLAVRAEITKRSTVLFVYMKMFCQVHVCVMVKPTNIVLDRQKFKCSPNNACSFSRGLRQIFLAVRAEMTKRSTVLLNL